MGNSRKHFGDSPFCAVKVLVKWDSLNPARSASTPTDRSSDRCSSCIELPTPFCPHPALHSVKQPSHCRTDSSAIHRSAKIPLLFIILTNAIFYQKFNYKFDVPPPLTIILVNRDAANVIKLLSVPHHLTQFFFQSFCQLFTTFLIQMNTICFSRTGILPGV